MIDERFYPATDLCDWLPLLEAVGWDTSALDGWMFMCADTDGRRFYKHSTTRDPLALSSSAGKALKGTEEEPSP